MEIAITSKETTSGEVSSYGHFLVLLVAGTGRLNFHKHRSQTKIGLVLRPGLQSQEARAYHMI